MQLTKFSDYALRVLMYAHAAGDRRVTITGPCGLAAPRDKPTDPSSETEKQ